MDTAAAPRKRFDPVAYLKLFRFPLVFTAMADSAAAYLLLTHKSVSQHLPTMGLLAAASGGLYLFGMALNDISDVDKDRQAAPNKVLPSGRVSLAGARIAALLMLLVSLAAVVFTEGPSLLARLLVWTLILAAILAYDLHWVKASPIMGLVRALNLNLGIVAARLVDASGNEFPFWGCAVLAAPLFIYVTSLTYVSTLEDASLDRKKLLRGATGMAVGALLGGVMIPLAESVWRGSWTGWKMESAPGMIDAWLLVGWIVFRVRRAKDRKGVMLLVRDGVAGIILVDAALLLSVGYDEPGLLVAALLLPAVASLALFKRLA